MASTSIPRRATPVGGFGAVRTGVLGIARALSLGISSVVAAPLVATDHHDNLPEETGTARGVLFAVSMVLVLLGGAFAGLTIAYVDFAHLPRN